MATVNSNTRFVADHAASTPADPNLVSPDDIASYMLIDAVAISSATSKAVSTVNSAAPDSSSISTASSKASSAASQAVVADSKAVSGSLNTSTVDSKASSGSVNTSVADSKATSIANALIVPAVNNLPGFIQPLTGAVIRTANAKMAERITVKDFNASAGGGLTDDRAAFVAANTSGAFVVTPGTYRIGANLIISAAVTIEQGALFKPDSGVTVTFTGPVLAGYWSLVHASAAGSIAPTASAASLVPVQWFGAVGDGVTEDSGAIQRAVDAGVQAFAPPGYTFRCDNPIICGANARLMIGGTLRRNSANSGSTRPLVMIQGDFVTVAGLGQQATLQHDNTASNGIILYGTESPTGASSSLAIRWPRITDVRLLGNANAATKGIACQSVEHLAAVGALYDARVSHIQFVDVGIPIYLSSQANANSFDDLNIWNCTKYAIQIDGNSTGLGDTTSGCNFSNVMVDGSVSITAVIFARSANFCCFSNINGEPGGGKFCDIDSSCSRIQVNGADNTGNASAFGASLSSKTVNGVTQSDSFVGTIPTAHTGTGTASAVTATFTTLFGMTTAGLYVVTMNLGSGSPAFLGACFVNWDGSSGRLFGKDVGVSVDLQISGDAVQGKQSSGSTQSISYSYLLIA